MTLPSELELEMVAAVLIKELDCTVEWLPEGKGIKVTLPWMKYADPAFMSNAAMTDSGLTYVS
jgi:hypothetical protein